MDILKILRELLRLVLFLGAGAGLVWLWQWATPMKRHRRWIFWLALALTILVGWALSLVPKSSLSVEVDHTDRQITRSLSQRPSFVG